MSIPLKLARPSSRAPEWLVSVPRSTPICPARHVIYSVWCTGSPTPFLRYISSYTGRGVLKGSHRYDLIPRPQPLPRLAVASSLLSLQPSSDGPSVWLAIATLIGLPAALWAYKVCAINKVDELRGGNHGSEISAL